MVKTRFVQGDMRRTSGRGFQKKWITIHETDNTDRGATADAHARLQKNLNPRMASWGWTVDDKEAVQSYTNDTGCWATGNPSRNTRSIDVEVCVNGDRAKAWANASELVRDLMADTGIDLAHVVQHNEHSGKNCPAEMRGRRTPGVPTWDAWKKTLTTPAPSPTPTPEDDDMLDTTRDYPAFSAMLQRALTFDARQRGLGATQDYGPTMWEHLTALRTQTTALTAAVEALATSQGLDPAQVTRAVSEAVSTALAGMEITLRA